VTKVISIGRPRFYHNAGLRAPQPLAMMARMTRVRASELSFVRPEGVSESSVVSAFRVPPEAEGRRLDVFVHSQLHRTSRTRAQEIVRASAYDPEGRRLKPNDRVRAAQEILLWRAPWDETPVPVDVPVLYEDDHLLAVDKPALLPVHPSARYHRNTLIKVLQAARPDCAFLSLAHRLDRETSGVIVVSKTRACDRAIKRLLERREGVHKTYTAIAHGVPQGCDGPQPVRCELPLELDPTSPLKVKMRVGKGPGSVTASTVFEVLDVRRTAERGPYALVRCGLETGRQHQIRVHLAALGAPVVGDKLYGPDEGVFARSADGELTAADLERLEMSRHALHATRLELPHPITGAPLAVEAPMPADITAFWRGLEG
jgi:23S rRNA pseudouridine1911/1915/1917 synthase